MGDIPGALIEGLGMLFTFDVFPVFLVGVAIGMLFGILPGLGGLTGLGLLLPFAFGMDPAPAFAFLLGMAAVTTQTDTIPAVLIGVPGTALAQATYLDGYPMSKRGEAGRALSASYLASILGTVVALVVFIALLPLIRIAINKFQSPEFFMLAMWGLVMVGAMAGTSLLRGLIIVGLGLMLAAVGFSLNTNAPRFSYGFIYLEDGLPLVPVALGLFAIPEVIDLVVQRRSIAEGTEPRGGIVEGFIDNVRNGWLVLRSGVAGTVCGMIPGLGGVVAEWFAYGMAVQSAKDPSQFGKGDVRGVIAPEAATASASPGALLPTVAFGLPGNAGMAILLGAFLIVGLVPGRSMLTQNLPLTFMMVWTTVVGNIMAGILALLLQRYLVKICYIRATIIAPVILCFMAVGATMATGEFPDLMVFVVFGIIGYIFKHADWPRVPLMIGFVLGGLAENALFISVARYGVSWLYDRPIIVTIEVLAFLTLALPLYRRYRLRRQARAEGKPEPERFVAARSLTWWVGVGILAVTVAYLITASGWEFDRKLYPMVAGIPVLLLTLIALAAGWRYGLVAEIEPVVVEPGTNVWVERFKLFGWIFGLLVVVVLIGHQLGIPLFLAAIMIRSGESLRNAGIAALLMFVFVYGLLDRTMHILFPVPYLPLWHWLGL